MLLSYFIKYQVYYLIDLFILMLKFDKNHEVNLYHVGYSFFMLLLKIQVNLFLESVGLKVFLILEDSFINVLIYICLLLLKR